MEERIEWLMVVPSFQTEVDFDAFIVSKMDDESKGGRRAGEDKKKTEGEEVWAGKYNHSSYCS